MKALLPHLRADLILEAYDKAGGKEIASGKFENPESSAALAANLFGFFCDAEKRALFPRTGQLSFLTSAVMRFDLERSLRFPWKGGLHPWLDAVIETESVLAGIESKRFEPFRRSKQVSFSEAYDRKVWSSGMEPVIQVKDAIKSGSLLFRHLDAVQLVKHAFGIATQAAKAGKTGVLIYAYAEPTRFSNRLISEEEIAAHRAEIQTFANLVAGADVNFIAIPHREFLGECLASPDQSLRDHAVAVTTYLGDQFA